MMCLASAGRFVAKAWFQPQILAQSASRTGRTIFPHRAKRLLCEGRQYFQIVSGFAAKYASPCPCVGATQTRRAVGVDYPQRSEEHTSEIQSIMRISYAV